MFLPKDVIKSLLYNPIESGSHFIAKCPNPNCQKDKHFYFNFNNLFSDCKKCGASYNIFSFLKEIGRPDLIQGRQVNIKKIELPTLATPEEKNWENPEDHKMPIGFKKCSLGKEKNIFTKYLINRKFTEIDFNLYNPGYTNKILKYSDYVIVPIENDFSVKGFVGRYIGGKEGKLRYLNSKSDFAKLIFGYDEIKDRTKTLIITEGIFDKISVTSSLDLHFQEEIKCVCTFGKKISEFQKYMLKKTNIENIIMMYDSRDAVNDMKKIGFKLKNDFDVYVAYTGINDPGDSTKEQIVEIVNNIEIIDKFYRNKVQIPKLK